MEYVQYIQEHVLIILNERGILTKNGPIQKMM